MTPDLVFVWAGVVTFTERLVTHFSGNKTHEAGGHYANDGPYLCPDTSSEKYKWRRNTLCHTQPVARREIWGLELSLKMFTLTKRGLIILVSFHILQTCSQYLSRYQCMIIRPGIHSLILMSMFVQCQCCILTSKTPAD